MRLGILISSLLWCLFYFVVVTNLTGCGSTRGWRFEIGVSPVSNLENKAGLTDTVKNQDSANRY